jgi:hypothetical protein
VWCKTIFYLTQIQKALYFYRENKSIKDNILTFSSFLFVYILQCVLHWQLEHRERIICTEIYREAYNVG